MPYLIIMTKSHKIKLFEKHVFGVFEFFPKMSSKDMEKYQFVVIGEKGCGKSQFTIRFVFNEFRNNIDPMLEPIYDHQKCLGFI